MASNSHPEVNAITVQTPDLVLALSSDPVGVAGILLSKGFISGEIMSKILVVSYTPKEKATILIEAVRNKIELAPSKFTELLEILSEVACAKEVVESLRSTYQSQLDQVDDRGSHEPVDIATKIETLENRFDDLQTRIINELSNNPDITAKELLNKLTRLPLTLRKEYESLIEKRIEFHGMRTETQINDLFIFHLNPLSSFMDYGLIDYLIKKFGSDGLKKDMVSYCSEMVVFMKETTIEQLRGHLPGEAEAPPKFTLMRARIGEDPSKYTLEEVNTIRKQYCSKLKLSEMVLHLLIFKKSKSFIVWWVAPSVLVSDIMKSARTIDQSFYQEYKISSLTLDGMWLFLSSAEIDAMWLNMHVGDTEFSDQFHIMYKQILCAVDGIGRSVATDKLSSYLMDQQPTLQQDVSVNVSETILSPNFPISLVDFRMLTIVIELFGSDCLKRVMESYCHFMSTFLKHLTLEQLIYMPPIQSRVPEGFLTAECKIKGEPFEYELKKLFEFQTKFCSMVNIDTVCFVMGEVRKKMSGSFTVSWYIPSAAVSFMKFTRNIFQSFYQEYQITSLTLDGMWIQLCDAEIDAMWSRLHVSDTNFKVQFHAMYKQIVYELEIVQLAEHELSSHIKRSLKCQQSTSDWLSHELLNHKLPVSVVDCRVLAAAIEGFGSNCLKSVMSSYSKYLSTFLKKPTAQQLINLSAIQLQPSEYSIVKYRIKKKPSQYKLEEIFSFRTSFCTIADFSEFYFVMDEVATEMSGSFTVSWLVPPAFVSNIMKFSINVDQFESFSQGYRITSLTLDGRWLYMRETEIDAMWSRLHVNDTKFKDQFHTMYKQIVYELEMTQVTGHQLSLFLKKSLKCHQSTSDSLSRELLNHELPVSIVDFRVLAAAIEGFGSHCLNSVMSSYSKYLSTCLKKSTAQQLINLSAVQLRTSEYSIVTCRIKKKPSQYKLDEFFSFRTGFCTIADFSEFCFVIDKVATEMSGSFTVNWLVPPAFTPDIMKSSRNVDQSFYQEYKITSLTLDGMWLYMSKFEVDAMWSQLHVSDTKFEGQFHTIYKQIVYELEMEQVTGHQLSLVFEKSLKYHQSTSYSLSHELLNHKLPVSVVDFRVLAAAIEGFGSDCLKSVMSSYSKYISTFLKKPTAQQLINLSAIQLKPSEYSIVKCKIEGEPSEYKLDKLFNLRTRFCAIADFSELCFVMDEISTEMSGSFTVSWLVPPVNISGIMKFTRNIDQSFYQEYEITSLTLDDMWIFLSDAEIDVLWVRVHPSDFESQFLTMYKQIVCEFKAQEISKNKLSLYLMDQRPKLPINASIHLSEAFLEHAFPLSVLDFQVLSTVIDRFGCDCLISVMKSFQNNVRAIYTRESTVEQLVSLPPIPSQPSKYFVSIEGRNTEEPSDCRLARLLNFQARLCNIVNVDEVCFIMDKIEAEAGGSFIVQWHVPSNIALDILKSANQLDLKQTELFQEMSIPSLQLGGMWLYNYQLTPLGIQLRKRYQQFQGSPSPVEWIPSPTKKIFRLAMIQRERVQRGHIEDRLVHMTISGRVDDILHAKSPVELEHIFRNTLHGGEIILIEGAPGSGKSTLTIHICQRWGKGELFQQFTVVILVQLRDPAVQRAQTIADLLPVENAEEIAAELIATNGRGVLFVLDGWDELPPHLQQESIFRKLFPSRETLESASLYYANMHYSDEELWEEYLENNPQHDQLLAECSVIVTSRPISSGDLHPVVSSRIEVLGFTPEEQRQYFTECLEGDTNALEALLEKIQENPVVQSICYLPLSAAFIVHTFKYRDQSLPNTEYEIYLSVILSCIQRHYDREGRGHYLPRELASLDDLSRSEAVREPFQCLYELAYRGVMENKVTFSSSDLPQGSNTLSLLQAIESFLQSGKLVFYNFLHLSVQEVLSAYYITTKLSVSEQMSQFQQLFNQPRFAAVFQFYAAITKLKSPGIRQVIDRIVEAKSKPLLISLLRCLHEAQDAALCLYVAERLEYRLDLSETSLSPLDCLSISFFLSSFSDKKTTINLDYCTIGDLGAKCLSKYLSMSSYTHHVTINLKRNDIHDEGASYIAKIFSCIEYLHLDISRNPIGVTGTSYVFQAVRESVILKTLILICGTIIDDLLPVENVQEIATELRATNGCSVLWILDDLQHHRWRNQGGTRGTCPPLHDSPSIDPYCGRHVTHPLYSPQSQPSSSATEHHLHSIFLSPKHNSNIECSIIVTSHHTIDKIIKENSQPLLVSLLRCLYKAQDPAICLYVAERLNYTMSCKIDLSWISLSPLDCLSVSFFLSSLIGKETSVYLNHCTIGDLGAKGLSKYLHADNNLDYVSEMTIHLARNDIREEGALHIARMLYLMEHLYLSYNPIGDTGASLISKSLKETATLKILILCDCGITSKGAEDLSMTLAQNSSLEKLDIGGNSLKDDGISHVAEALKQNKQLKELWIGRCGMADKGAASLASALTVNNSLKMLHIGGPTGALTEDGLSTIAHSLAKRSLLVKLAIPYPFGPTTTAHLSQEVNEARKRNGLPSIEIKVQPGHHTPFVLSQQGVRQGSEVFSVVFG